MTTDMKALKKQYLENLLAIALSVRDGDATWRDVADFITQHGESAYVDTVRKGFKHVVFRMYDAGFIGKTKPENPDKALLALYYKAVEVRNGMATWKDVAELANAYMLGISQDMIQRGFKFIFQFADAGMISIADMNAPVLEKPAASVKTEKPVKAKATVKQEESDAAETSDEVQPERDETGTAMGPVSWQENKDGTRSYDRLVELYENPDELTEERILGFFRLNPGDWVITSCKCQAWHGLSADKESEEGRKTLYNLRIGVRPKLAADISISDLRAFFEEHKGGIKTLPAPELPVKQTKDGNRVIKQIDYADPHFGLLAWKHETGEQYDLDIAQQYTMSLFEQFVDRNRNERIDEIVLVTLGDIVHIDNTNLETTHGTKQDVDGRIPKILNVAVSTLVSCIRKLRTLGAPVKYVYVPGNHDEILGYAVAKLVEASFYGDPNVTFDTEATQFKCMEYGATAVSLTHGEPNNRRLANDLLTQHRDVFGRTQAAEVHAGHLHSEHSAYAEGGIKICRVPAVCESSYWEKSKGFASVGRGMQAFTYWTNVPGAVGIENYYTHACEAYHQVA